MRRLITTDSHLLAPPSIYLEMPARLRQHTFFLQGYEERPDGRYVTYSEERRERAGKNVLPPEVKVEDDRHLARLVTSAFVDGDASPGFTPHERLVDMDREGVEAAVLIGAPEFNMNRGPEVTEAQILFCRLTNDWLADTYKDHLGRFAPGINLPWMDPKACVAELERAAALGLRPAIMPDGIWDHPYWESQWEPLWEAASGLGIPVTMHIAAIRNPPPREMPPAAGVTFESFYGLCCAMGQTLMSMAMNGVFERYPDLTIVMTEGYAFWLAGVIQFMDHHFQGNFGSRYPLKKLEMLPGSYIKRQAMATFMWDPVAIHNREITGVDCLLWGNDYPHAEGIFPDSQMLVEKQFAGVPEDEIARMTFTHAREIFKFDVPELAT